jgi:hypothetical protein
MKIERLNVLVFEAETQRDRGRVAWGRFFEDVLADDAARDARSPRRRLTARRSLLKSASEAQSAGRAVVPGSLRVW